LQHRFLYSLTASTGHGKTALALLIATLVGSRDPTGTIGEHDVQTGHVLYFVGENPDDIRMRVIGIDAMRKGGGDTDLISFIPGVFNIAAMRAEIERQVKKLGGVQLVIVDTSAAYFLGNDEIANTQMGEHARMLRTLTTFPGKPCVLVLCHPVKTVTDPAQLVPRGGGAFLAEMDGNLTLWKRDETIIELHHNKIRGPGFEPICFRLEKVTTTELIDKRGRIIPTVRAVPVSDSEEERQKETGHKDEQQLLIACMVEGRSVADLAQSCGWLLGNGKPHKSKVDRVLKRLETSRLIKKQLGSYSLTTPGKAAAKTAAARMGHDD
jgi:hypothetical protein